VFALWEIMLLHFAKRFFVSRVSRFFVSREWVFVFAVQLPSAAQAAPFSCSQDSTLRAVRASKKWGLGRAVLV
jgi:hypothetical protein